MRTSVSQNASNTPCNIVYSGQYSRADSAWASALWAGPHQYLGWSTIAVANKLPDALTGGVAMGELGGPIFYTDTKAYPFLTDLYLYWNKGSITKAYVLGGLASIPEAMVNEVNSSLKWPWVY